MLQSVPQRYRKNNETLRHMLPCQCTTTLEQQQLYSQVTNTNSKLCLTVSQTSMFSARIKPLADCQIWEVKKILLTSCTAPLKGLGMPTDIVDWLFWSTSATPASCPSWRHQWLISISTEIKPEWVSINTTIDPWLLQYENWYLLTRQTNLIQSNIHLLEDGKTHLMNKKIAENTICMTNDDKIYNNSK